MIDNGAELFEPTNEYELVRFRCDDGVGILYTNKAKLFKPVGPCVVAWEAFNNGNPWRATPIDPRRRLSPLMRTVRKRDGHCCFYCWLEVGVHDGTLEHLVSRTHGGPDHIANLFLAHQKCNQEAGNLSAVEKIKLREGNRRDTNTV